MSKFHLAIIFCLAYHDIGGAMAPAGPPLAPPLPAATRRPPLKNACARRHAPAAAVGISHHAIDRSTAVVRSVATVSGESEVTRGDKIGTARARQSTLNKRMSAERYVLVYQPWRSRFGDDSDTRNSSGRESCENDRSPRKLLGIRVRPFMALLDCGLTCCLPSATWLAGLVG
jgi:hypothetical protein